MGVSSPSSSPGAASSRGDYNEAMKALVNRGQRAGLETLAAAGHVFVELDDGTLRPVTSVNIWYDEQKQENRASFQFTKLDGSSGSFLCSLDEANARIYLGPKPDQAKPESESLPSDRLLRQARLAAFGRFDLSGLKQLAAAGILSTNSGDISEIVSVSEDHQLVVRIGQGEFLLPVDELKQVLFVNPSPDRQLRMDLREACEKCEQKSPNTSSLNQLATQGVLYVRRNDGQLTCVKRVSPDLTSTRHGPTLVVYFDEGRGEDVSKEVPVNRLNTALCAIQRWQKSKRQNERQLTFLL